MRKIDSNKGSIPDEINYSGIIQELDKIAANPNYKANGSICRGEIRENGKIVKKVAQALCDKYDQKCGYCESDELDPKVEHHRPVGQVSGGKKNNNGYYWLAYEWTNMVASCTDCNNPPNKGRKFPITTSRAFAPLKDVNGNLDLNAFRYDHAEMLAEGAELLHPEFMDDSIHHFEFNRDGEITGVSPHGIVSSRVYGLGRDTLNVNRRRVYEQFERRVERLIRRRLRSENPIDEAFFIDEIGEIFRDLLNQRQNESSYPYTKFTRAMIERFEHFFIEPFDDVVHDLLRLSYKRVLEELLR